MATYHTRNLIVIIFCSFLVSSVQGSRGVLRTDGIVQVRGERGAVPRVTVMPFDSPAGYRRECALVLELEWTTLSCHGRATGCVTKQLYFDTRVSIEKHAAEFTFPFRVILEMHDGAQAFTYAGPVGFIRYHHEITDFAYETDYTATVDPSFAIRAVEMQRTGSDPLVIGNVPLAARVVTSKYHRPNQEAPERVETDAMGTLAPMVAEVPRMVHRTGRPEEAAVMVVLVPGTTELEVLVYHEPGSGCCDRRAPGVCTSGEVGGTRGRRSRDRRGGACGAIASGCADDRISTIDRATSGCSCGVRHHPVGIDRSGGRTGGGCQPRYHHHPDPFSGWPIDRVPPRIKPLG